MVIRDWDFRQHEPDIDVRLHRRRGSPFGDD